MSPEEVKALLTLALPGCEFQVQNDGNHYLVIAIGQVFEGQSPVKRQQTVYAALQAPLQDGRMHAVTIRAHTPVQWAERQG